MHSIDGALMRLFISGHYNRTGRKINHLHDCVLVAPEDVDIIYDVIRDVYCDPKMKNLASSLVFSRFISETRGDSQKKIKAIHAKFLSNMESLDYLNRDDFDPRKCYRFEGSK